MKSSAEFVVDARPDCRDLRAATWADDRFRRLVGEDGWASLPIEVRRRFSGGTQGVRLYSGRVVETRLNTAGRVLAFAARLIGGPLPLDDGASGPAVVSVVEDREMGGQVWSRSYPRPGRFPQMVHSAKRFCGPTGLEEYVGAGVSMSLVVSVEDGALVFRSKEFFVSVGGLRLRLPRIIWPGEMTIEHRQIEGGRFWFVLRLRHGLFGCLLHQRAWFEDA